MENPLTTIRTNIRSRIRRIRDTSSPAKAIRRARDASRPIKAIVTTETAIVGVVALVLGHSVANWIERVVELDQLPPWRAISVFPFLGATAALIRLRRPDQTLRRWHGAALRRIDERFG